MKLSTHVNMKTQKKRGLYLSKPLIMALSSALLLAACANAPKSPDGAVAARNRLVQLQNDPALASRVSVAIREADNAVTAAEVPMKDKAKSDHLVFIATREVDIAWAQAKTRQLEAQRAGLNERRDNERLESRTREADRATYAAAQARTEVEEARREIDELNAKETERGLVVTLGDMLFETGNAQLTGNAFTNLEKLSSFLNKYPQRALVIEGHTDSVGSESSNQLLSQRRADSVRQYLLQQGIASTRLTAFGKGESYPVASNDSTSGRALNRRVEVIISK
uniref:OmpA family protein n=1 Tax=Cellvibrio fontiphilus TaxID=1815559 RepID=UPI002B4C1247|nr:OmpA family protein [Cellvibrio fontiphilus]